MVNKDQIYSKLAEVEALLMEARCDGEQLAELDCYRDIDSTLAQLVSQVEYYID